MSRRLELEKRKQDRARLLESYRGYVDQNSPPMMSDLRDHMRPLLEFGYANLPELLNIVNAKIFPMRVINDRQDNLVYATSLNDVLDSLRLIDTRDNAETLRNSTANKPKQHPNKSIERIFQVLLVLLAAALSLGVAYLVYRLGWQS